MAPATLAVDRVQRRYGSATAVDGVSLTAHGGVVALVGPNGAGKTTLLRCLATVLPPSAGSVHVDGLDVTRPDQRTVVRRRLGYLPQEAAFAPNARVFDVVDYVGIVKEQRDVRRRHADVLRVLGEVGLRDRAGDKVKALSGGMRRRLGIAQALLGQPGLVLLDEPATGLDPEQRLRLRDRLARLGEEATVVVSTHLIDEVAALAHVIHVLDRGRLVWSGTPAALAGTAAGRVWRTPTPPLASAAVRAAWRQPDGSHRCVGTPPPGAELLAPTLEDGYLLLVGPAGGAGDGWG
ncbi:MAG: ATP-binding cassette domain-containing protein [Acidimicrobiales bacterium]